MMKKKSRVMFQSAVSGLWYENIDAAGFFHVVRVDGDDFIRVDIVENRLAELKDTLLADYDFAGRESS